MKDAKRNGWNTILSSSTTCNPQALSTWASLVEYIHTFWKFFILYFSLKKRFFRMVIRGDTLCCILAVTVEILRCYTYTRRMDVVPSCAHPPCSLFCYFYCPSPSPSIVPSTFYIYHYCHLKLLPPTYFQPNHCCLSNPSPTPNQRLQIIMTSLFWYLNILISSISHHTF